VVLGIEMAYASASYLQILDREREPSLMRPRLGPLMAAPACESRSRRASQKAHYPSDRRNMFDPAAAPATSGPCQI